MDAWRANYSAPDIRAVRRVKDECPMVEAARGWQRPIRRDRQHLRLMDHASYVWFDHCEEFSVNQQLAHGQADRTDAFGHCYRADGRPGSSANLGSDVSLQEHVVGQSDIWQRVLTRARRVAPTDTTVLLQGESGTGKEVVARLIHAASPRKNGPFVAINCAAVPETLFESELFGFERGAFTGAQQAKPGQLEVAQGGVLFLDEVSELPLTAQVKLLRMYIQEREFVRLGGTRPIRVNVRVIAATNQDMRSAIAQGRFQTISIIESMCSTSACRLCENEHSMSLC